MTTPHRYETQMLRTGRGQWIVWAWVPAYHANGLPHWSRVGPPHNSKSMAASAACQFLEQHKHNPMGNT